MNEISCEIKERIFQLVSTPGVEMEDIPGIINKDFNSNYDYETIMTLLSDEYLKHNLDYGRRLCCRF